MLTRQHQKDSLKTITMKTKTTTKTTKQKATVITFTDRVPMIVRGGKKAVRAVLDAYLAARATGIHPGITIQ